VSITLKNASVFYSKCVCGWSTDQLSNHYIQYHTENPSRRISERGSISFARAEVKDLGIAVARDHDVVGLEIAMDNTGRMRLR